MLYRDIMAMFLGIHLTVLVIAIPKNSQFDALVLGRVYIDIGKSIYWYLKSIYWYWEEKKKIESYP